MADPSSQQQFVRLINTGNLDDTEVQLDSKNIKSINVSMVDQLGIQTPP